MTHASGGAWSRPLRRWVGVAATLTVLLRLPFLTTPLNVDEGGYATIASEWASGAQLYRDVWVDRPQGLLVFYRPAKASGGHGSLRGTPHNLPGVRRQAPPYMRRLPPLSSGLYAPMKMPGAPFGTRAMPLDSILR